MQFSGSSKEPARFLVKTRLQVGNNGLQGFNTEDFKFSRLQKILRHFKPLQDFMRPHKQGRSSGFQDFKSLKDVMRLLGLHKISRLKSLLFSGCATDQKLQDAVFEFR
jgi:hypothetical protein